MPETKKNQGTGKELTSEKLQRGEENEKQRMEVEERNQGISLHYFHNDIKITQKEKRRLNGISLRIL